MDNIVPISQQQNTQEASPFDRIRRHDNLGREYWLARELMELLEYVEWRNFRLAIEEAIENLELSGIPREQNFLEVITKSLGRDGVNYQLTRMGCYHV
jgi:DNA-damage-inducible protein D